MNKSRLNILVQDENRLDQAEGLRRMRARKPIKVIAIASGKGGVGKTNVAVNLAVALAQQGAKPLLFDADLGLGNVDVLLGLSPRYNLSHVISGEKSMEEVLITGPWNIRILPAASGVAQMANLDTQSQANLIQAVGDLSLDMDYLLIDLPAGIAGDVLTFSQAAQEVLVVLSNEPASITDAYALIKVLSRNHGVRRFKVLPNMVRDQREGDALFQRIAKVADGYLDVTLEQIGSIPLDPALRAAVRSQKAVVEMYPDAPVSRALQDLAVAVERWPHSFNASGHMAFFMERLLMKNPEISI
ncbi:MinD/ParA family protein [Acidithiobacillus sulfurivorans]|uniref:MinD/ParA family protein n=1 Tax=Acidithiobacillus sulfurivorans TaxID=1958756 RepID=A0ABS5ZZ49_9PROT|nr:MinD/ParA family protein [Acidithiobacillus sulfurivorans]MBU2760502.1 MinD/ParA family protein [Acidithiobacillus sulfurivorans]